MKVNRSLLVFGVLTAIILAVLLQAMLPGKPVFKRHVDPSREAEQPPYSLFFTMLLTPVFDDLTRGNFTGTMVRLRILETVSVPSTLRYVFNRFSQLMQSLTETLTSVEKNLDQAETLIDSGREEEAKPVLTSASYGLASANVTFNSLRQAVGELTRAFRLPSYEFARRLDAIGELLNRMLLRLLELLSRIEEQRNLSETLLEIGAQPGSVWVGSTITVEGRLSSLGTGLPGRIVTIFLDGKTVAQTVTLEDGFFKRSVSIPHVYKPTLTVSAKYSPGGGDEKVFKPACSNTVEISLLYVTPVLNVKVSGKPLPGRSFTLEGTVETGFKPPYETVKASWLTSVSSIPLSPEGFFKTVLHVPENLQDGRYALRVETPASGVFAPASKTVYVNVERLRLNLTLEAPQTVFAGLEAVFKGFVAHPQDGEQGWKVRIIIGDTVLAEEAFQQGFETRVRIPFTMLTGYCPYRVQVEPGAPWFSGAEAEGRLLVVNPLAVLASAGSASILMLRLAGGRRKKSGRELAETVAEAAEQHVAECFIAKGLEWLMDLYWQAVAIVSSVTGVDVKPSMTMREYLNSVAPNLGEALESFERITLTAEKALYSPSVSGEELQAARQALEKLKVTQVASLR
ncbi:MAG: DUF4129 domain-containing protein [Thermoproteota archaeon]